MSKINRNFKPNVRKRKAYITAFRVFISYFWLHLKSKLFGHRYSEKRIKNLHIKNADRIKVRVEELQGLFIKVGQMISNLSNVLPKEFRGPLEGLQDHIQPKPYSEIEKTIEQELGNKPELIFTNFNIEPLAAASIGQVHRAEFNGRQVAVKIQHQNIEVIAKADLEILKNLVRLHGYFMDMQGLDHSYEQVRQMIEEELDYTKEARAMQKISANLVETPELNTKIPVVFDSLSTSKILTTEYFEGVKIGQIETLQNWGLDLEDIAKRLLELYCKMILVDGFYHADPHPGNILVNKNGEVILLDFGAVAHLNEDTKKAIPELIEAVVKNNSEEIVLALKKMGFIGSDKASRKYVEKLVDIFKEFIQEEVQFDGMNFQNIQLNSGLSAIASIIQKIDLREVSNTIKIPKDYILLNRTIVLLMGNAFQLAPDLNTLDVVRPYMKKHILDQDNGFAKLIINTFKNQITTAISLPNELSQFLKSANRSEVDQEIIYVRNGLQKIYLLGKQVLYALLLIALMYFNVHDTFGEASWIHNTQIGLIVLTGFLLIRSFYLDWKIQLK